MPLVLPDQGLPDLLDWMIRHTGGDPPDLVFTLWTNNITPDQATVLTDLTRASFPGFFEVNLTRSGWTAPAIASDHAVSTWGTVPTSWTLATGTVTIYGWAAYNFAAARLVIVERFDTPRVLNAGDTIGVLPQFTLTTAPP
jgi:hypothetical protein